jgi:hypothetical protein
MLFPPVPLKFVKSPPLYERDPATEGMVVVDDDVPGGGEGIVEIHS